LEIPRFDRSFDQPLEEGRPPVVINSARDFFSAPRYFSAISGGADAEKFDRFRTAPGEAANINIFLNANLTAIRKHRRRRRIESLNIACLNGRRHTARGRTYVLATGGMENVRLLLASGLGNESDLLGRNFMGHVTFGQFDETKPLSMVTRSDSTHPVPLYTDNSRDRFHCVFAATLEGQRRFSIGNFTTTMFDLEDAQPDYVQSALKLSAALDRGSASAAPARPLVCFFMSEQLPYRESRITLDPANIDALGMPKLRLEWVYSQRDFDNLEAAIAALSTALGETNTGRVCWPVPRNELLSVLSPSRHHMGTTRMNADAAHGVVDAQCRLHDADNLYVAGSSVFPTSGIANPTLTIIALAMRMSDHLKRQLGVRL
jgi:choline dehydrogenase-like flavoprotein